MAWLRSLLRTLPIRLLALILAGAGLAVVAARLAGVGGTLHYHSLPNVVLPLPATVEGDAAAAGSRTAAGVAPQLPDGPPAPGGPPVDPHATMLEPGPYGALPRPEPDGATPFAVYRRPVADPVPSPAVAIVLVELGLDQRVTSLTLQSPPPVALVFSPYTEGTGAWLRLARWHGHETLLALPLQASDPAREDRGPLSLAPELAEDVIAERLARLLAKASGVFALAGEAGSFADHPDRFRPVAQELARRGLGFLELGGRRLREVVRAAGAPYATAVVDIDRVETPEAIDLAFGALEATALEHGRAIGYLRPLPLSLRRLSQWLPSLPEKGLFLVPPGALFE
jgi:polysaccharide deacetylase 2 family uncharacterized protein YibQ